MGLTIKRDAEKAALVKKVARITGYSKQMIYKVLGCERENEEIMSTYMELLEMDKRAENKLLSEVNRVLPFNK